MNDKAIIETARHGGLLAAAAFEHEARKMMDNIELLAKLKKVHNETRFYVGPTTPGKSYWCSRDEILKHGRKSTPRQQESSDG